MIPYLLIFVPLAILATIECTWAHFRRRDSVAVATVFLVLFWAMAWLKWERGTDWGAYFEFFNSYALDYHTVTHSGYEWGFSAINYLVRSWTDNYTVMLAILATLLFVVAGGAICRYSRRPVTSVLVLYCIGLGFIFFTRQTIAVGFVLAATGCIVARRKWGFVLCVAAGALFHYSILIFLPAYWLFYRTFKTRTLVVTICAMIVFSFAISNAALSLMAGLPGFVGAKIAHYLDAGRGGFEEVGQSIYRVIAGGVVNRGGILLLALIIAGKQRTKDTYVNGLLNLYTLNFVLFLTMAPITVSLTRLASYYDILIVLVVPLMFDCMKLRSNRTVVSLALTAYFAWRFFFGALGGFYGDLYVPFNTIFTKDIPMIVY